MRLSTLAIGFTLADAALTGLWIRLGVAREGNPLLDQLVTAWGPGPAMTARAAVGVGLVVGLSALRPHTPWATPALAGVTVILGGVVGWHLVGAAWTLA